MRIGDAEYTKLVEKHLHKLTVLSEKQCAAEIAAVEDGAISSFVTKEDLAASGGQAFEIPSVSLAQPSPVVRKRGRPVGSKNKPK